jgi:hypothetical protein
MSHPLDADQAEQAGQPARVTCFAPGAKVPVRAGHRRVCAGSHFVFLSAGAQVQVVLQQLPHQSSPGFLQMFFQLGVAPRGRQLALQRA